MKAARSLIEASAGFGLGVALAFVGHMFLINSRPSDLRLLGPSESDVFVVAAAFTICSAVFFVGLAVVCSIIKARVVRASGVIAIPYGALVYALAFFVMLAVYHLAEAPSPALSTAALATVVFISGVFFGALSARTHENAS